MTSRRILVLLAGGIFLAAAITLAGGYNVAASAGHWLPVKVLLHWTMRNSVTLRAGTPAPADLDSEARAKAGAGHYDLVCRDCHGAPGVALTAVARSLEPPPPHILAAVESWTAQELFWIVKHGIRMTAMPAWPAEHRDDEVWSVVAFLLRLPELDAEGYRRAVEGPPAGEAGETLPAELRAELARCARCHGYDGRGVGASAQPRIDGMSASYLHGALAAYASGRRASGIMQSQASAVEWRHLEALARHYAGAGSAPQRVPAASPSGPRAGGASAGARIARRGIPERKVPACAACHGPTSHRRAVEYPPLAGQDAGYLERQLRLFREGRRGGSAFAAIMTLAAQGLRDDDIAALARYYAGLGRGS